MGGGVGEVPNEYISLRGSKRLQQSPSCLSCCVARPEAGGGSRRATKGFFVATYFALSPSRGMRGEGGWGCFGGFVLFVFLPLLVCCPTGFLALSRFGKTTTSKNLCAYSFSAKEETRHIAVPLTHTFAHSFTPPNSRRNPTHRETPFLRSSRLLLLLYFIYLDCLGIPGRVTAVGRPLYPTSSPPPPPPRF